VTQELFLGEGKKKRELTSIRGRKRKISKTKRRMNERGSPRLMPHAKKSRKEGESFVILQELVLIKKREGTLLVKGRKGNLQ